MRSFRARKRSKWVAVFALVFAVSSAASVFAEAPPPEGPVQVTVPAPSDSAELEQLPNNAEMTETLAQFQAEDEAKQQELESPAAVQEREESADSYAGVGAAEAEELLTTEFSSQLEALDAEPARFLSGAQLIRPLGEDGALVSDEGRTMLIEGTAPVLAPEGGGKIDLSLEAAGSGYQPANPIVPLEIPASAKEGVAVGEEGVEISQAGTQGEPTGRLVEELNVFYPEVHTDTDLLVSPTATGVELFDQLRSEDSPEELRFHLQMPAGAQLRSNGTAAEVIAADASKLAEVPPPTAVDAQGTQVPVHMETEGDALVLDVRRAPEEFAYPILVDPVIEEWYWANWYEGKNLQALEPPNSPWHWNTSDGPSSPYVYGSTSCIYTCWSGSHRGLYMSVPNGSIPAGKWGQWSYSAPNSETYLENAWVSPYWRDDHVNCPSSTYSQPYDYVGMWNESSWNRILYNESTKQSNQGWADIESWGRAFIIGMGTSSAITPKCWRDIMAGGTRIWLEDWSRPNLTTSSSSQWMDATPIRLNVSANDAGLGVQKFKATAANTSGGTSEWLTASSCTGLSGAPCPHAWNLNEPSQPQLNFAPSVLPEGIDKLSVTAYDAAEKPSFTTNEMTVRVDHSAPAITLSGTLTQQESLGTERPTYKVNVVALDGDPNAKQEETTKIRSGVVSLETSLDGQLIEKFAPKCAGESDCGAEEEILFQAPGLSLGQHTFKAVAKDALGHVGTKELKFTINADRTAPKLSAGPLPGAYSFVDSLGALGSGNGQFNHPADVAIDAKGNLWAADENNHRLEQFNEAGEFVKAVGSLGSAGGQLRYPTALAIDSVGNVWVADTANNRVEEFNEKGEFVLTFGKDVNKTKVDAAGSEAERNLCTAASGNVCKGGAEGTANGQLRLPQGIAVTSSGSVWVADTTNNRIQKFGPTGALLEVITGEGTSAGKMNQPSSVAIGPDGSVWVADSGNNRIEQWSATGGVLRLVAGSSGSGDGQFARPAALEVDRAGNVWVGDRQNYRIQEFNERGEFVRKFGTFGTGNGQLNFSTRLGVAVDSQGTVWIADSGNNRLQSWTIPALAVGPAVEPLATSATDAAYGVTSLTVKLIDEKGQAETLDSATQSCSAGNCSMSKVFEALDLSSKAAGLYTLIVEATDGAGNSSRTSSRFLLTPEPPQLSLSGALAEGAGQPMTATAEALTINASETASASSGIRKIGIEVDHQRVATRSFNCTSSCQEVAASFRFDAARDGAERSIETAATPSGAASKSLSAISCVNASDCTAVGLYNASSVNRTLVEHWDGAAWQVVSSPNPSGAVDSRLESISCISASNCTAVGYYQTSTGFSTLIESWNGTAWSIVTSPNPAGFAKNYLYGVSCVSASECWAVGKSTYTPAEEMAGKTPTALLARWNGSSWTTATASNPPSQLKAVSCFSATACTALSGSSDLATERWNGTAWTRESAATPSGASAATLSGVACTAASNCTAVGSSTVNGHTAPLAERWNGTAWSVQQTTDPTGTIEEVTAGSLAAISCWSTEACTAVGTRSAGSESAPLIEGWDGTDWALQSAAIPSGTSTAALSGAACVSAFNCYAVGTKAGTNALIEREVPDAGNKTVTVEATDRYGNATSKSIQVDVPEQISETPDCSQATTSGTPKAIVSASEASSALQESVPAAVAPSVGTTNEINGEEVDPTYSAPSPNLESLGTPTEGETEVTPEGGFTIEGVACITPTFVTSAATEAKVVNGDAAVFANTAPETDTLLRPNAAGMTMVQSLRGSSAPTTISWNVTLNQDENLVELPSGAVAITRKGTEATGETAEVVEPEDMRSPAVLKEAELQLETGQYQLIEAESETTEEVIAVIPLPWIILKQGSIIPVKIEVEPDVEVPTEFTMTYEMPAFEPNFTPTGVVTEMYEAGGVGGGASASSVYNCIESPCGQFVVSEAVKYAKNWGKPERNSNYPDFHEVNCTNFLSQIMAHGGMAYMRYGEHEDGAWWVQKYIREPGSILFDWTESWSVADKFPRHLWQYGLAIIDPSNQPSGWTAGNILAEDWYGTNGVGDFNHVQFVSGTRTILADSREPLIANSSEPAPLNYANDPWIRVKERIDNAHQDGWNRVPLVPKHRFAIYGQKGAKKHDPANLYNANGVFHG